VISLDDPRLTAAQRAAAQQLITATTAGMQRFPDVAAVRAAGYSSIGDASTGYEHFVNFAFLGDGAEVDPNRIESIVAQVNPDGSRSIVSAMYILSLGKTMADVPEIGGPLTTWHDHQDLCWELPRVVALAVGGVCPRGTLIPTPPMLHVWMVPHPCGPFAGIETDGASSHGTGCGHAHSDPPGPSGPIISLDDPRLTSEQRAVAEQLLADAAAGLSRFPDVAALEAAGYRSIGDGGANGFTHYVHSEYLFDGIEMDPYRVESVVVDRAGGGARIASAMYILNWDKSMASVSSPPYVLAGELTTWHDHDDLCFDGQLRLRGLAQDGACPIGSNLVVTPPMLHVWLAPYPPCGPFAGIESHGGGCGGHAH
jgi:hypothetical protein